MHTHRDYYCKKADEWLQTDSTPAYLIKVERALDEERVRVSACLTIPSMLWTDLCLR